MALPVLTFKTWTGGQSEYFTHKDMTRVCFNANAVAAAVGTASVGHPTVTRASQFDYGAFQSLEAQIKAVCTAAGVPFTPCTTWGVGRSVSYVDFERVEAGLYGAYAALGGQGARVPSDRIVTVSRLTLRAGGWTSSWPWSQTLTVYPINSSIAAFIAPGIPMSAPMKAAMDDARLRATVGTNAVTVYADGRKPFIDLEVIIMTEHLSHEKQATLSASSWVGGGPWTQTITGVDGLKSDGTSLGVVGPDQRTTAAQYDALIGGRVWISDIPSDGTVTVSAIGTKPAVDIPVTLMYETDLTDLDGVE
jgi:hypothetical protein